MGTDAARRARQRAIASFVAAAVFVLAAAGVVMVRHHGPGHRFGEMAWGREHGDRRFGPAGSGWNSGFNRDDGGRGGRDGSGERPGSGSSGSGGMGMPGRPMPGGPGVAGRDMPGRTGQPGRGAPDGVPMPGRPDQPPPRSSTSTTTTAPGVAEGN